MITPASEQRRMQALQRLEVLDTAPESAFDALVDAAAAMCGTPVSLLSLIDHDRQWFKANHGLPGATQTPREDALCAHAILSEDLLEVPDATHDPRFAHSPLVTGAPHVVFYAGAPVRMGDGSAIGALCVIDHRARRLDDRQREVLRHLACAAAQALEGRRALLAERTQHDFAMRAASVLLHSVDAIVALDLDGCVTHWNAAAARLFGFAASEIVGRPVTRLVPRALQGTEADILGLLRAQPQGCTYETVRLHRDGTPIEVSVSLAPITGADGRPTGATKVIRDRRAQVLAARELAASEGRFRALSDAAPLGVFATDAEGACTYTNARWQALYGLSGEAALGHGWTAALHAEDRAAVVAEWRRCAEAGSDFDREFRIRRPQGEQRLVRARACPMRDEAGRLTGHVGAVEDVTELTQARRAADAAARAKSEFLASTSHEIRTPLNAILGLTWLLEREALPAQAHEQVRSIASAGRTLLGLVNDVLDLSKIEAGQLVLDMQDFDLRAVLADEVTLLGGGLQRPEVATVLSVDDDVPCHVRGDPTRLRQVLSNLLGNALKFTERGRVELRVRRGVAPCVVMLSVADTGIGIEPEVQARLFRPFEQADASTTRRYGGTGLGLSIAARLVALMGGTIALQSTPGEGSTFTVTLPLPQAEAPPPPRDGDGHGMLRLPGLRVLVVDDNVLNLEVARKVLELEGAEVTCCDSGPAALDLLDGDAHGPDAVLLDVQMPGMDGLSVLRALRARPQARTLPVIALSAAVFSDERADALAAGMDDFLPKPLEPELLVDVLRLQVHRVRGTPVPRVPRPAVAPSQAVGSGPRSTAEPPIAGLDEAAIVPALRADRPWLLRLLAVLLREHSDIGSACAAELPARLHKLRGAAGAVGARALAQAAERAERSPAAADRAAALREVCSELQVLASCPALEPAAAAIAASPASAGLPPSAAEWAELRTLLTQQNVRAVARVEALSAPLAHALGAGGLQALRDALAAFDFATALQACGAAAGGEPSGGSGGEAHLQQGLTGAAC